MRINVVVGKANSVRIKVHFAVWLFFDKVGERCELQGPRCLGVHQEFQLCCKSSTNYICVPEIYGPHPPPSSTLPSIQWAPPGALFDSDAARLSCILSNLARLERGLIKRAADSHTHLLHPSSIFPQ